MEDDWKDVVGYEGLFKVSSKGHVFSKRTNRVLKQFIHKNGYCLIATKVGGRKGVNKTFKVHRLVAEAFLTPPSEDLVDSIANSHYGVVPVNHKDGDKTNNCISNLEWCSYRDNTLHAIEIGLLDTSKNTGASNNQSFFKSEADRESAYISYINSGISMRKFAKQLGTTHAVISRIVRDYAKQ